MSRQGGQGWPAAASRVAPNRCGPPSAWADDRAGCAGSVEGLLPVSGRCAYHPGPQVQLATLQEGDDVVAGDHGVCLASAGRDAELLDTALRDQHPRRGDGPRCALVRLLVEGLRGRRLLLAAGVLTALGRKQEGGCRAVTRTGARGRTVRVGCGPSGYRSKPGRSALGWAAFVSICC
jgi:hypothetical protein